MKDKSPMRIFFVWTLVFLTSLPVLPSVPAFADDEALTPPGLSQDENAGTSLTAPLTAVQSGKDGEQPATNKPDQNRQSPEQRLDALFERLKRTNDQSAATRLAAEITTLWRQSGSATVDLLMQWANTARLERRYASAIDFLNEAIALDPDYAEAWNLRANVAYLQKDYDRAMADISHVLELEPRHFIALYSLASILRERGLKKQSAAAYERVLAVYPMFKDAQLKLTELADELAETRI